MNVTPEAQPVDSLFSWGVANASVLRIGSRQISGVRILDFGAKEIGGLSAGLLLARLCLNELGSVQFSRSSAVPNLPGVVVQTDWPLEALLLSQYAGWKIATDDYFAMASGPGRQLAGREALLDHFASRITGAPCGVLVLEGKLPTESAVAAIAEAVEPAGPLVGIAVARTRSMAGTIQVVARSAETALHRLHHLNFPVQHIRSAFGCAPLPRIPHDDLAAIGKTNDAILYGAEVTLWVDVDDDVVGELGPQSVSAASDAHGHRFLEIFEAAGHDFYAIDPALFSPAVVTFQNLRSGRQFTFGEFRPDLVSEE